jgi:hypothetical protein
LEAGLEAAGLVAEVVEKAEAGKAGGVMVVEMEVAGLVATGAAETVVVAD